MNELRDYLNFLKKNSVIILLFGILGVGAGFFYTSSKEINYEAVANLYIINTAQGQNERYYTYDGYYSQLAAKEYTDTLIGLIKSLDFIRVVASDIGTTPTQIASSLRVRKTAPAVINLSVTNKDAEAAKKLVIKLTVALNDKISFLNPGSDNPLTTKTLQPEPFVNKLQEPIKINTLLGAFVGMIIAIVTSALITYLKPKD